jgi:hypothetical protein
MAVGTLLPLRDLSARFFADSRWQDCRGSVLKLLFKSRQFWAIFGVSMHSFNKEYGVLGAGSVTQQKIGQVTRLWNNAGHDRFSNKLSTVTIC